jgi:hypothetical protein
VHREILTFFHRAGDGFVAEFAVEHVNFSRGEFACRDAVLEEVIQFGEGSASGFWDTEVGVDDAQETCATIEEAMSQYKQIVDHLQMSLTPRRTLSSLTNSKQ